MTAKATKKKTYGVTGTLKNVQISVDVLANTMEDALIAARKLQFKDFIDPKGDIFDYEGPQITSIWEN